LITANFRKAIIKAKVNTGTAIERFRQNKVEDRFCSFFDGADRCDPALAEPSWWPSKQLDASNSP
jgi:hypothetical protein